MKSKYLSAAALLCAAGLAACGGKGNGSISLGVQVFGLDRSGLVLQNNGGDDLAVAGTGNYYFPTLMAPDSQFNVTIKTLPADVKCTLANNSAKINYYTYLQTTVNCAPDAYALGGTVSGLTVNGVTATGLVLANGAQTVGVSADGAWQFANPVPNGTTYGVTVLVHPTLTANGSSTKLNCSVTKGTAIMPPRVVNDVTVACAMPTP